MHDDCLGWLSPYPVERNYALYTYLEHQDLAVHDPNYKFLFSEIPNLIAMMELEPARFEELKGLIAQGRVELANAFVLEPTINLSGGEALVMQGVEGLRWYSKVMHASPRYCYMIDITGWSEQMAQIVNGLGLDAFIYCRYNPFDEVPEDSTRSGDAVHWIESPDGTRALAVNPGHYVDGFSGLMRTAKPVDDTEIRKEIQWVIDAKRKRYPKGCPLLTLCGENDYSHAFRYHRYPTEMLRAWEAGHPATTVKIATLQDWFGVAMPLIKAGKFDLRVAKSGSKMYGFTAFWVNAPKAKQWYRRSEHALQATEAAATVASLRGSMVYPSQELSNAWLLMSLNMDRGPLWGIGVGGLFEHPKFWDVRDRFEAGDKLTANAGAQALRALFPGDSDGMGLFNPTSWPREEPFELALPPGKTPASRPAQLLEDGKTTLVSTRVPATGVSHLTLKAGTPPAGREGKLPEAIETPFYSVRVDAGTGALLSMRLKPSGREVLGAHGNVILAQVHSPEYAQPTGVVMGQAHKILDRAERVTVMSSVDNRPQLKCYLGPLATIVEMTSPFRGGELHRVIRFYSDSPRIDFVTETQDLPDGTIVVADFPLHDEITMLRRGIPYGFAQTPWSDFNLDARGNSQGIVPVIRWSHYMLRNGVGVALFDRGVPARELTARTATILLHNAIGKYFWDPDTKWMNGQGRQIFQYSLLAHETPWEHAGIPQAAWSYNAPLLSIEGTHPQPDQSFLSTSANVVVEAVRRVANEIEIRLVESNGTAGPARLIVRLPHESAAVTNMLGENAKPLRQAAALPGGGSSYSLNLRPQQIVTVRLKTLQTAPPVQALTTFASLIPEAKREATLTFRHPELIGHPPQRGVPDWKKFE